MPSNTANDNTNKSLNAWIIFLTFVILKLFLTLKTILPDPDTFFILATGKNIVETGTVPTINPFVIHSNLSIIIQQWLFDVIIYQI